VDDNGEAAFAIASMDGDDAQVNVESFEVNLCSLCEDNLLCSLCKDNIFHNNDAPIIITSTH